MWLRMLMLGLLAIGMMAWGDELTFDLAAINAPPLDATVLSKSVKDGIVTEEVRFHSETDGAKRVDIFAFFCYPEGAKGLPAFVWNQAGAAQAATYFPLLGAKRGYAVICIDLPLAGYRSTGGYGLGVALDGDPKATGIYHSAIALLRAVSYLQSRPEVDPERIGMAGSSWGGLFTTLMAGIDPRLKAASCMFGCGALQMGNRWWGVTPSVKYDAMYCERWRTTLDPAYRLPQSKVPICWFTGTNDVFFWMPSLMESYARAGGPKALSLYQNWDHGLPPHGDEQVFVFLDTYLQGKPRFIEVSPLTVAKQGKGLVARWTFTPVAERPVDHAELLLSYGEDGNWSNRYWDALPANIKGNQCEVKLPSTQTPYFITGTVVDTQKFRYSTPIIRVSPTEMKVKPTEYLQYNGCGEWGDFEENHLFMQRGLGYPVPPVRADAYDGAQSAVIKGTVGLLPIFFTGGLPHRLTCYLKAAVSGDVTLKLAGTFDDKTDGTTLKAPVQDKWTQVTLDYTPPPALLGKMTLTVTAPAGTEVLLDGVSFRPVPPANK